MTHSYPHLYPVFSKSDTKVSDSFKLVLDSLGHGIMSYVFGHIPFYSFILVYLILLDLVFKD